MKSLLQGPAKFQRTETPDNEPPILSVECQERDVVVLRHVRRMRLTPYNLNMFWEKSRKFPTLFGEEINADFQKFLEVFLFRDGETVSTNGLFWVVDDFVGVFYLTHIVPGFDAQVHYSFFDRRQNGREELTKAMIKHVFDKYEFRRLSAQVPCYAHETTFSFIQKLGFTYEGRKRKASLYRNDWFDVKLFGVLKEEYS